MSNSAVVSKWAHRLSHAILKASPACFHGFPPGSQPPTTRSRSSCRRAVVDSGRRRQRQNAGHHPPHRAPGHRARRAGMGDPGRHLHQQSSGRDAGSGALACSARPERPAPRRSRLSTPSASGCCAATANASAEIRPGFTRQFTIYDDDDQTRTDQADLQVDRPGRKVHAVPGGAFADQPRQESRTSRRRISTRAPTTPNCPAWPSSTRSTKNGCAPPMRSISTTCCSRPSACCATTPALREQYGRRIRYLLIDEYQDTNRTQYDLMRLLTDIAPERLRGGRRGPVDLRLARRRHPQHPRLRARLSGRQGHPARAELSLDQDHPRGRHEAGRQQRGAQRQVALDRLRAGRSGGLLRGAGRRKRSALRSPTRPTRSCGSIPTGGSRCSTARTPSPGRSKKLCAATDGEYTVVGGFSFYQRAEVKDLLAYLKVVLSPARLDQPAAHHQQSGARHRQDHGRADRAVRAAAQPEPLECHRSRWSKRTLSGRGPERH